eukprot:729744-Hanusia_phi.AAC.3
MAKDSRKDPDPRQPHIPQAKPLPPSGSTTPTTQIKVENTGSFAYNIPTDYPHPYFPMFSPPPLTIVYTKSITNNEYYPTRQINL